MSTLLLSTLAGRLAPTRRWRLVLGLALPPALLLALLAGVLLYARPAPPNAPADIQPGAGAGAAALPQPAGLLVEVTGAVVHPGLYRVARGERTAAAIAAAGGITVAADPDRLPNMAARLQDGAQVRVPTLTASGAAASRRVASVDLNTATAEQLASVPGFSPELVAAAIRYRTDFGGFTSTRELVDVLQMSESAYALARRYVTA